MKTTHTPGPWHVDVTDADADVHSGFGMVACTVGHPSNQDDEGRSNARLIAAAPELLAALESIAGIPQHPRDDARNLYFLAVAKSEARAAIAKVKQ